MLLYRLLTVLLYKNCVGVRGQLNGAIHCPARSVEFGKFVSSFDNFFKQVRVMIFACLSDLRKLFLRWMFVFGLVVLILIFKRKKKDVCFKGTNLNMFELTLFISA